VEFDLVAPRIALHDPVKYSLSAGEWAPLALERLVPTVAATFEGREGRFHLDIGSNTGLTFQEPTVRQLDLLQGRELNDCKLGGVGGFVAAKEGRVAWLELGGVRLADVPATFLVEDKGLGTQDGRDGSIGTKVLESFHVTLDYAGGRISFRRREARPAGG
jgi:Aspartyl protease